MELVVKEMLTEYISYSDEKKVKVFAMFSFKTLA